jgi:hypothetical protein
MMRARLIAGSTIAALFALALYVRLTGTHAALLYPDGYQYLLMARGISEHLRPTTRLGPGGAVFVPNADAAVKPLFPILVAATHLLGLSWLQAARAVTAVAGAISATALAILVTRLGGSTIAGIAAATLLLTSPTLSFWSGFEGPDPLAQALVLLAALAFVHRRARLGGVLTGLAIVTRPEIVVLALAASIVALHRDRYRSDLKAAGPVAAFTALLVGGLARTPLAFHEWRLLIPAAIVLGLVSIVSAHLPHSRLQLAVVLALVVTAFAMLTTTGLADLASADWPLLLLGAAAVVGVAADRRHSSTAMLTLGAVVLLGAVYSVKNPSLTRYFSLLLPAVALLVGLGLSTLRPRVQPLGIAVAALVAGAGIHDSYTGSRDYDMFRTVARQIAPALGSSPLVTAAPDAYGFWLPAHEVLRMEPGARGAIVLDAAQRLYEPRLTARGHIGARISDEIAFSRPDGEIDAGPALLVDGTVVTRPARVRELPSRARSLASR